MLPLVGIGAAIAVVVELFKIPSLAFAVGVYLPLSTMMSVFFGGALRWIAEKRATTEDDKDGRKESGILFGSGLVGGEGLLGVGLAMLVLVFPSWSNGLPFALSGVVGQLATTAVVALLIWFFHRLVVKHGR